MKISQHVALLLNLGVLKELSVGFGGQFPPCPPPLATALALLTRYFSKHSSSFLSYRA